MDRIVRYRVLAERITDPQASEGIKRLLKELEAEMQSLPPDE